MQIHQEANPATNLDGLVNDMLSLFEVAETLEHQLNRLTVEFDELKTRLVAEQLANEQREIDSRAEVHELEAKLEEMESVRQTAEDQVAAMESGLLHIARTLHLLDQIEG